MGFAFVFGLVTGVAATLLLGIITMVVALICAGHDRKNDA